MMPGFIARGEVQECVLDGSHICSQGVVRLCQRVKISSEAGILLLKLRDPRIVQPKTLSEERLKCATLNPPPALCVAADNLREISLDFLRKEAEHRLVTEIAFRELVASPLEADALYIQQIAQSIA